MEKYFVMVMKEAQGCPSGFYYACLVPDFKGGGYKEHYGKLPWYAGPKRFGGSLSSFPSELNLIVDDENYSYDVRSGSAYFYVLSEKFRSVIALFKTNICNIVPVRYLNRYGEVIGGERYYAAATERIGMKDVVDFKTSKLGGEFGDMFEVLRFKENMDYDLLDIFDAAKSQFTLIVSDRMRKAMIDNGIKGVDFLELDSVVLNSEEDISKGLVRYSPV